MAGSVIGNGSGYLYAAHGTSTTYTNLKVISTTDNNAAGMRAMLNLAASYFEVAGAATWNASADQLRFFVHTSGAIGTLSGATEISDYVINRGLNSTINTELTTIDASDVMILTTAVAGSTVVTRKGAIQIYEINATNSAGNDDLDTITITDVQDNDIVIVRNATSDIITVTENGNLILEGNAQFTMDTQYEDCIAFIYRGAAWYELWRQPNSAVNVTSMRLAGIPQEKEGVETYTILAGTGTTTIPLKPGQHAGKVYIAGSCTLSAAYSLSIDSADTDLGIDGQGLQAGDTFVFIYNATVTVSSYSVTVAGVLLTPQEALLGGVLIYVTWDGTAWRTVKAADTGKTAAIDTTYIKDDAITEAKIVDGAVTSAKLDSILKTTFSTGNLYSKTAAVVSEGSDTTSEVTPSGYTYTLPANTLLNTGDKVRVRAWGTTGSHASAKTIKLKFDSLVVVYNATTTSPASKEWHIDAEIIRTGASATLTIGTMLIDSGGGTVEAITTGTHDSSLASTNVIAMFVTAGNSDANCDITCSGFIVDLLGASSA